MKKLIAIIVAISMLAVMLTACGNASPKPETTTAAETTIAETAAETTAAETIVEETTVEETTAAETTAEETTVEETTSEEVSEVIEASEEVSETAAVDAEKPEEESEEESETQEESAEEESEAPEESAEDQAAADNVQALIEAIQVQERTEDTDAQCEAAKAAWDALTDEQKELVEDGDYFARDTGDASLDDPRNQDEIGEKELLVVSFGTSFNDSREQDIKGVEDALAAAYPDWAVRRAFTAQIIINHIQARDGEVIDNMTQALDRAVANGVTTLVVQPTHLMHGAEYDEMCAALEEYKDRIGTIVVAEPLLGEVGSDATVINEDKAAVAQSITAAAVAAAGYESLDAAAQDGVAFVFMGHGTAHTAKVTYSQMNTQMAELGYANVFVGTVEGEPEETACEEVIAKVQEGGFRKVILRPLMVVAGDHANNDMADPDDEESWLSMFAAAGFDVECQIAGLGRIPEVEELYIAHTKAALETLEAEPEEAEEEEVVKNTFEDGTYTAELTMEGGSGKATVQSPATVIVKDGQATAVIVWSSDKYDYMVVDGVHYDPITTEGGSTFQIPVAAFDEALPVIGDTTAMSQPHEVEYTFTFDSASMTAADDLESELAADKAAAEEPASEAPAEESSEEPAEEPEQTEEQAEESPEEPAAAEEAPVEEAPAEEVPVEEAPAQEASLEDGVYTAEFNTDSSMFHVNEANEGKGVLTVKDGEMTIHVSLVSKKIVNLFPGLAEDAQKDGAAILEPTVDTVTYSDGMSEEVFGFDVPVPAIGTDFDLAILGKSGEWYDHKVSVSNPVPAE